MFSNLPFLPPFSEVIDHVLSDLSGNASVDHYLAKLGAMHQKMQLDSRKAKRALPAKPKSKVQISSSPLLSLLIFYLLYLFEENKSICSWYALLFAEINQHAFMDLIWLFVDYSGPINSWHCPDRFLEVMGPIFTETIRPVLMEEGVWNLHIRNGDRKQIANSERLADQVTSRELESNSLVTSVQIWAGYQLDFKTCICQLGS